MITAKAAPDYQTDERVRCPISTKRSSGCGAVQEADAACLSWSRRRLVRLGLTATACLLAGFRATVTLPTAAWAQNDMTPDQALKELMDGNRRFVEQPMTAFNDDLKLLKEKTADSQAPFAGLLSCADSRVPVELIFDQTIGKLFVTRVAGNIATADLIASLEYGARCLAPRRSWCSVTPMAALLKLQSTARPCPGRSARFTAQSAPRWTRQGQNWRQRSRPTPRSKPDCCAVPRRCWPS